MRSAICRAAVLVAILAVLPSVSVAKPPSARSCKSSDLRYPFRRGGPRTFGVFALRVTAGRCTTAHRVARDWMRTFEKNLRAGRVRLPRSIDGFAFATLRATEAQTYNERGRKGRTTIRFSYRVPNG